MSILIYGAAGYTGSMVARQAKGAGLDILLGGRDETKLAALANELGVACRIFQAKGDAATQALSGVRVLLNCAGPFALTAEPLMRACIAAAVHYLDITAEIGVYQLAERLGPEASRAGVMLLPGVGWDVVPTDCLAMQLAARVDKPTSLRIALQVAGSMSRGSAISAGEIVAAGVLARQAGQLVPTPDAQPRSFDFGQGAVACAPLSFGDLVTAWHSTGIPNIEMFVNVTGGAFPVSNLASMPDGPSAQERATQPARAVVEVTADDGTIRAAVIETVNGYTYTPLAAVEAARHVVEGNFRSGFQTPARVFGPCFAEAIPGTRVTHLT